MSQQEWKGFWDSAYGIIPIYLAYAIASTVVSLCGFLEKRYRKEAFSLSRLIIGLFCDVAYGLTLATGAMWLTNNNHCAAFFVLSVGVYRGRRWADKVIDTTLKKHFNIEEVQADEHTERTSGSGTAD